MLFIYTKNFIQNFRVRRYTINIHSFFKVLKLFKYSNGDNLSMDCFCLVEDYCRAKISGEFYKPTPEEKRDICQNALKYKDCVRFKTHNMNLRDNTLCK